MSKAGSPKLADSPKTPADPPRRRLPHEEIQFSAIERAWLSKLSDDWQPDSDYLALYIDAPFCLRRCSYCVFFKAETKINSEAFLKYYAEDLPALIDLYRTILERAPMTVCYIGGGTGNFMTTKVMRDLFDRIPGFRSIPLKKMEGHPALFTKEKIDLLCEYKFTDISMGVQTFDGSLLTRFNRIPLKVEKTRHIVEYALQQGLRVNCDLLVFADSGGLADLEVLENDLVLLASEIHPSHMTIYPLYQLFVADRNDQLLELREELINRIAHLRCTILNFALRFPEYSLTDLDNVSVSDVFSREQIWRHLSSSYNLSRLTQEERNLSFMYNSDYFYDKQRYPQGQRQHVIGLGGANRSSVHSYICGELYYVTSLDEGNINFQKRVEGVFSEAPR